MSCHLILRAWSVGLTRTCFRNLRTIQMPWIENCMITWENCLPRIFQVDAGGKTQSIESRKSFRIRGQFGLSMTLAEGRQLLTFKSFRAKHQTLTSKIEGVLMVNVCTIHSVRYYLEMSHVGHYGTTHPKSNNRWLEIWRQRIEALDLWRGKLAFREYPKDDVFDASMSFQVFLVDSFKFCDRHLTPKTRLIRTNKVPCADNMGPVGALRLSCVAVQWMVNT